MATVDREKLISSLLCVRPGLANKEHVEHSTSFVFKSSRVWTYNDMIAVSCPIDLKDVEGGVLAEQFYNLLTKVNDKEVDLSIVEDNLCIKGSKFNSKFAIKQGEVKLPMLEIDQDSSSWILLPKEFTNTLKFCLFSVSTDLTRLAMTCLHLSGGMVESCDNFRLTRSLVQGGVVFPTNVLLPASSAKELIKYSPTAVLIQDGWAHFKLDNGAVFSCRTYEGEFPDTKFILEMEEGEPMIFPTNMGDILERAESLAEVDLTGEQTAVIEIQNGEMKVVSKCPVGEFEEKSRVRVQGHYKFECNIQFLQEILKHLRTAEVAKDGSKLKFIGDSFTHVLSLQGVE